jgi:hypothetical protein
MINNAPRQPGKYHQGLYVPQNKGKLLKANEKGGVYYRSSWEKKVCIYLDMNEKVVRWGCEFIEIPYMLTEVKNDIPVSSRHRYYPDFYYELKKDDGSIKKVVVEIKPKSETLPPKAPKQGATRKQLETFEYGIKMWNKNLSKWQTAISYCESKGVEFVILTEDFINRLKY